jgi:hypothetical protein
MENRAAVFTSQPQDVEVYRDGAWWSGALLGWRHDAQGSCQVWVRVVVRGSEETSWLALELLRLPEPAAEPVRHLTVVGADSATTDAAITGTTTMDAATSADDALTGTMAAIRAVPVPRTRRPAARAGTSEVTSTTNFVAIRDAAPAPVGPTGGRRRAPELRMGEQPAVAASPAAPIAPGRHRAPASTGGAAGRHRAADTGVWPAVRDDEPVRLTELPRPTLTRPPADEPDAAWLTRPMRLDEGFDGAVPQPRRPRRDGRLSV